MTDSNLFSIGQIIPSPVKPDNLQDGFLERKSQKFVEDEIRHDTAMAEAMRRPPIVNPTTFTSTRHRERPPPTMFDMLHYSIVLDLEQEVCDGKSSIGLLLADWNKRFNEE